MRSDPLMWFTQGWWTLKFAYTWHIKKSYINNWVNPWWMISKEIEMWVPSDWCEVSVTCNIITTNNGGVSTFSSSSSSYLLLVPFLSELILISSEMLLCWLMQRDIALVADWISYRQICKRLLNEWENCSLRCKIANIFIWIANIYSLRREISFYRQIRDNSSFTIAWGLRSEWG